MPVSKKEVGECPVDAMMRVMDGRWKGTILWRLHGPGREFRVLRFEVESVDIGEQTSGRLPTLPR